LILQIIRLRTRWLGAIIKPGLVTMKKTQKYLVAYLDLLGTKHQIETDDNCDLLNIVSSCYENVIRTLSTIMPISGIEDCKIKVFSDNIIVAIPSDTTQRDDHHPIIALNRIGPAVRYLQREFLNKKILIRGGVTYGQLYIDDVFVWGKALIDAYSLESTIAKYPRIVIDQSIVELKGLVLFDDQSLDFLSINKIKKDYDGEFFFDYLNYPRDVKTRALIDSSLDDINMRIESETKKDVLEKYIWHRNYLLSCNNVSEISE